MSIGFWPVAHLARRREERQQHAIALDDDAGAGRRDSQAVRVAVHELHPFD